MRHGEGAFGVWHDFQGAEISPRQQVYLLVCSPHSYKRGLVQLGTPPEEPSTSWKRSTEAYVSLIPLFGLCRSPARRWSSPGPLIGGVLGLFFSQISHVLRQLAQPAAERHYVGHAELREGSGDAGAAHYHHQLFGQLLDGSGPAHLCKVPHRQGASENRRVGQQYLGHGVAAARQSPLGEELDVATADARQ